ncbi:unnamed protein product, partial [Hymenolepis diminuta]
VEFATRSELIKGISRILEHSEKYGDTTDRLASKCGRTSGSLPSQPSINIPTPKPEFAINSLHSISSLFLLLWIYSG